MTNAPKRDCRTCTHATVLYQRITNVRFHEEYQTTGVVQCSAPRYKGRRYHVRDSRGEKCTEYERNSRGNRA